MTTRKRAVVTIGLGVYLVTFGTLTGMVIERVRFDRQRAAVLARYDRTLQDWQAYRIALEKVAVSTRPHDDPLTVHP